MGAKYTTNAASGYNSSPPADDGSQVAANLVKWSTHKTKLADPVKTLADDINTDLVAAFDYSVRQITTSDNTVAGDHMRCVEIAPTVSSAVAVTVSLGDAATMTNIYRVYIKNSSPVAQTIGRVTAGDTINAVAGNLTIPAGQGVVLQTTTGANGYITVASSHPLGLTAGRVPYMGNTAQGGKFVDAAGFTFDGTTLSIPALTLTSTLTLSGTAANIATGANYISYGGTDAGLSLDSSNNALFSANVKIVGSIGIFTDPVTNVGLMMQGVCATGGISQTGLEVDVTGTSGATQDISALAGRVQTPAASFTCPAVYGCFISDAIEGSGSTITTQYGYFVQPLTTGTTNWAVYTDGTTNSYFGGILGVGTTVMTGASGGNTVLPNAAAYRFVNVAGSTSANYGLFSAGNSLQLQVPVAGQSVDFVSAGNTRGYLVEENSGMGLLFIGESSTDHSAPATNNVVLYTRESGAKTQLCARFATGAVQVVAAEP